MLLAIDIGNSNVVCGISSNEHWCEQFRIHTVANKTADEYEVIYRTLLASRNIDLDKIDRIVLSSVVPSLIHPIKEMIQKLFNQNPLVLGPEIYPQLNIGISNPYEIGTDLVANAVAAHNQYSGNCIVVDFGTALTFTVIQSDGNLLGVTIAPGLKTAMASLSQKTAQLPNIEIAIPPSCIGKNTVHAMQAGIVLGYKGLIESLLKGMKEELNGETTIIATGGLSSVMLPLIDCFDHHEPMLTLDGLKIIGKQFYK
ncbi:type III pantothenate kinase [Labilibaculum sp. DW002]|uniref:Type III pantothenate kinase n=1 Tax=Paralabilibaculum antarcticum TaxID=2912572 RepID=A0ABT5VXE3_9BACT|nr:MULTISPECIES: type III pantothenate kinase [unclassified Labilibaculum]MBI9058014.1 type III pantothenate kinase [Labilibaculum sp.]MDE5418964.1 type III pantothenate kinase [Labilibaculum sp. DW002]